MSIITRVACLSDVPAVAELFDLYRQFYEQPADLLLAQEFINERFTRQESVIIVAQSEPAGLVGFCQLYPTFCSVEASPIYVLYDLFVLPSARNVGVGSLLLRAAEAKAAAEGRARMDLSTARANPTAQSLYESLGWIRDEVFWVYSRRISQP